MFKNVMVYKLGGDWTATWEQIEEALGTQRFEECGPTQERSAGWVPPRGEEHGPLVESVGGQYLLRLMVESKAVPASVVKRKAEERAQQIEATTGRKPGKKEIRDLREEAKQALLPVAFSKRGATWVWIDPQARRFVVDAGSQNRVDEIISLLVKVLDGFVVQEVHTATSATAAMSEWLSTQEPPAGFTIDRECELKATDASKAAIRYAHHPLDIEEIRQHIAEGKLPTKLAMTWDERVSFVLTESMQLRKLQFQDGVFEKTSQEKEDSFDADAAISTGEIGRLLPGLLEALGGEIELKAAVDTPLPAAAAPAAQPDTEDAPF
ncbi:recombination-associated protein RdgC [Pseudorhodoferax aquiterrae]|uniref:Recombination-associated protein RdgC n=1 Tax=Pseudorhodoferax aquiterrae TaxID=747304 RepID=A0ABQ3G265_9BURK|nr:recombination-associated protein RdgC [Pseudorhodoferax aquiterrae]GHC82418.1 recombination-associated protein RdgC [Pseudorhodoferax aquiterrae]